MNEVFRNHTPKLSADEVIEQAHPSPEVYPWIPNVRSEPPGERGKNWSTQRARKKPQVGRIINKNRFGHGQLFEVCNMI